MFLFSVCTPPFPPSFLPVAPLLIFFLQLPWCECPPPYFCLCFNCDSPLRIFRNFPDIVKVKPVVVSCFEIPGQPFPLYNLMGRCLNTSLATALVSSVTQHQMHRPPSRGPRHHSSYRHQLLHSSHDQHCRMLPGKDLYPAIIRQY